MQVQAICLNGKLDNNPFVCREVPQLAGVGEPMMYCNLPSVLII